MDIMNGGHICDRPSRISRMSCCHFVFLLNDTAKIPLCTEIMEDDSNSTSRPITFAPRTFTNSYSTPVYLHLPQEIPEDHVTFLFGILLLISVAVFCVILIMKLTKPKLGFARLPSSLSFPTSMDYDLFLWLPRHSHRRSSLMLFLRSVACRPGRTRQTSLSVVSNSSFGLLPTYRSAASTTSITPNTILPPPPYDELENLTTSQLTASTYVPDFERASNTSSVRFSMPRHSDQNNNFNQLPPNNRRR